jgi:hypothetical protein
VGSINIIVVLKNKEKGGSYYTTIARLPVSLISAFFATHVAV